MDTNEPIQPVEVPQEQKPKKSFSIIVTIAVLIILAAGVVVGMMYLRNKQPIVNNPDNQNNQNTDNPANPAVKEPLVSGLITWNYPQGSYAAIFKDAIPETTVFYDVGVFQSGQYKGDKLIVGSIACDGPCPPTVLKMAATPDRKSIVVLKKYSDPMDNLDLTVVDATKFTVDSSTTISDLETPESISGPATGQQLVKASLGAFRSGYNIFNVTGLKFVFHDPKVGDVYTTPDDPSSVDGFFQSYGYYVKMPDWGTLIYQYVPNFISQDKNNIPQVTWSNGTQNADAFNSVHPSGCGASDYAAVVDKGTVALSDLKVSGKTSKGDSVYEFLDANAKMLKDMYDNEYNPFDPQTFVADPKLKISYTDFVAQHPMFFWVDPFGRLIQFKNQKFLVHAAECGKPVIYLYPTKTEQVSVKLDPVGGFKYTEPAYNSGWNVLAQPSGTLTLDGKNYPYLFWEGWGGLYQTPDKGFVVAKNDVHSFLVEKLAKLGLNQKESADFMEFWEPYMNSSPYYFVTFMGNSVMDRIAPLSISPKPDTIIRILMDYKPLDKPIAIEGFDISTPQRNGFTVVEWGGVKH